MPRNKNIASIRLPKPEQRLAFVEGKREPVNSPNFVIKSAGRALFRQDGASPAPPEASLNLSAFNVLFSLGVTLAKEKKNYSLLDDQTNTEVVENIAIFDPIYATLTNTPTEAKDKFSNNKDPFYELDDALPQDEKRRRDKIIEDKLTPQVQAITADIIKLNVENRKTPTLKQFANNRDHSEKLEKNKKRLK